MKPPRFAYAAPRGLTEALVLLGAAGEEGKVLAGGQSLMPLLNFRLARPAVLIDFNRVRELAFIRARDGLVSIGAMTRQRALERSRVVAARLPLLREAIHWIGHPPIRNRGTVGGSLAHADPAAELPALACVLDATMHVKSATQERTIAATEFFEDYFTTALRPGEALVAVDFPEQPRHAGSAVLEVARRHGDFALAGAAVSLCRDRAGRARQARIALFGVGSRPVRAREAEAELEGQVPEHFGAAASAAVARLEPPSDVHATAAYRQAVARELVGRALAIAWKRAKVSDA
jgi:carbon-monoxide dehydrogenase medium subunit